MRLLLCAVAVLALPAQERVNPDAAKVADFDQRVQQYFRVHEQIQSQLAVRPQRSVKAIREQTADFAARIRAARTGAKQGDFFPPEIAAEFRRLIGLSMQGQNAKLIGTSLRHAEPVSLPLAVNATYPARLPRQSTPPTLLSNLPRLPQGLEYRVIGHALTLCDASAHLILDFVPNALPSSVPSR